MKKTALTLLATASLAFADRPGTLPAGPNGKPLNLDFESGTLADWTATGKAFDEHNRLNDEDVSQRLDNLVALLVRTTEALHPGERPA